MTLSPTNNANFQVCLGHSPMFLFLNGLPDFSGDLYRQGYLLWVFHSVLWEGQPVGIVLLMIKQLCLLQDQRQSLSTALWGLTSVWGAKMEDSCRSYRTPEEGRDPRIVPPMNSDRSVPLMPVDSCKYGGQSHREGARKQKGARLRN